MARKNESWNDQRFRKKLFLTSYKAGSSELNILINLSSETAVIQLKKGQEFSIEGSINNVSLDQKKSQVKLGKYGGIWLHR